MRIGQSKAESAIEAGVSISIGFVVAYVSNLLILPAFGFYITPGQNFWLTVFFTVISVIRSYFVRRLFNWWHVRQRSFRFRCKKCGGTITVIKGVYGATCNQHGKVDDRSEFGEAL